MTKLGNFVIGASSLIGHSCLDISHFLIMVFVCACHDKIWPPKKTAFFTNYGEQSGGGKDTGSAMSMPLLTPPPKADGPLPCGSATVGDMMKQRRTGEAARGERMPVPRRKRQIVSVTSKARAPRTRLPSEQACQSVIASYYVGPLND